MAATSSIQEQNQVANIMAKEGINQVHFADIKTFVAPSLFVQTQLGIDNSRTKYPRQQLNNLSYAGRDVALG